MDFLCLSGTGNRHRPSSPSGNAILYPVTPVGTEEGGQSPACASIYGGAGVGQLGPLYSTQGWGRLEVSPRLNVSVCACTHPGVLSMYLGGSGCLWLCACLSICIYGKARFLCVRPCIHFACAQEYESLCCGSRWFCEYLEV